MKFLLCVDDSKDGRKAFETVCNMADKEHDEIIICCVAEPAVPPSTTGPYVAYLNLDEANKKIENHMKNVLTRYGEDLKERGFQNFRCRLNKGYVRDCILKEVESLGIDLLVMGRRGLSAVERVFVGSNSEYCIHNCPVSVLIVHGGN